MGKSILCRRIVEALPPECPLHRQCEIFRVTCGIPDHIHLDDNGDSCLACRREGPEAYDCYCEPVKEKKSGRSKRGKRSKG